MPHNATRFADAQPAIEISLRDSTVAVALLAAHNDTLLAASTYVDCASLQQHDPHLYSDAYLQVTIDDDACIVTYTRSHETYRSIETIREIRQKVRDLLSTQNVERGGLLIDVREAPPRNDDAFEAGITRQLEAIRPRFTAQAIVLKSAVGRLQAQRVAKSCGDGGYTVARGGRPRGELGYANCQAKLIVIDARFSNFGRHMVQSRHKQLVHTTVALERRRIGVRPRWPERGHTRAARSTALR